MPTADSVLRVAKWTTTFEIAESRRHRQLKWVSMPITHSSNGYARMVEQFGDRAPAIYGCWCALLKIAATCPVRGVLSTSSGAGLSFS